jgi:hypothetical protein
MRRGFWGEGDDIVIKSFFNLGTYLSLESEPSYVKNGVEEVV